MSICWKWSASYRGHFRVGGLAVSRACLRFHLNIEFQANWTLCRSTLNYVSQVAVVLWEMWGERVDREEKKISEIVCWLYNFQNHIFRFFIFIIWLFYISPRTTHNIFDILTLSWAGELKAQRETRYCGLVCKNGFWREYMTQWCRVFTVKGWVAVLCIIEKGIWNSIEIELNSITLIDAKKSLIIWWKQRVNCTQDRTPHTKKESCLMTQITII